MSATISTIPASQLVGVTPSVVSSGGAGLLMIDLMLTLNPAVPIGSVLSFPTLASVQTYFGATSLEAVEAAVYFAGYLGALQTPAALLFAQYPLAATPAVLIGGAAPSLTALQAITTGTLDITVNGTPIIVSSLNLSTATSQSSAGILIGAALDIMGATVGTITGSVTSATLTVTALGAGVVLSVGQWIIGTGETNAYISAFGTGTGGVGTYTLIGGVTVSSETLTVHSPAVTFSSTTGGFIVASGTTGAASTITFATGTTAATLGMTQATGAVQSQGAAVATPAAFMAGIIAQTQNWATFQTLFDPDQGSGNTQKLAFAAWVNSAEDAYAYICTDTDITPTQSTTATGSLGFILAQSDSSGTIPIYQPVGGHNHLASFIGGYAASIDYDATNGRATAAFRGQAGLVPSVTSAAAATNLIANGYNFYGAYATRSQAFNLFQPGQISGPFSWVDSYLDQIWLNSQCQQALLTLLASLGSVPYNPTGYGYIRHTLTNGASGTSVTLPPASPVAAALNNGVIQPNVPLSAEQAQVVNALAGMPIDQILSTQGWYLVIQPATAQVRGQRKSPTIILLFTDGESIQQVNLSSVLVQ